jgi:hypothetical protein
LPACISIAQIHAMHGPNDLHPPRTSASFEMLLYEISALVQFFHVIVNTLL